MLAGRINATGCTVCRDCVESWILAAKTRRMSPWKKLRGMPDGFDENTANHFGIRS